LCLKEKDCESSDYFTALDSLYLALFLLDKFIILMNKLMNNHLKMYRKSLVEQTEQSKIITEAD
jgi:hypothetical protein